MGLVRAAAIQVLLLQERLSSGVTFNPLSSRLQEDPYPSYRRLRERDPVHFSRLARGWILTRYEDVALVLRDPRFSVGGARAFGERSGADPGPFFSTLRETILFRDPPDHTRLRALVSKAFSPRAVDGLRPHVQEVVNELLDRVQDRGGMDAVSDLAAPLPVIIIAELLGIPPEDRDRFGAWTRILTAGLEPLPDTSAARQADAAATALLDYLRTVIDDRRRKPQEDLISGLVAVEEDGDRLTESETLAFCALLLVAGSETTTNLIGNGLLALMRHPRQLRRLRDDPSLAESAVEELLRYDCSIQIIGRVAMEDLDLGGRRIRRDQFLLGLLGAANRDPLQFPNPEVLDLSRTENHHLALSLGIHYCLGAPLARIEGRIAFRTLLQRMPNLRLNGRARWRKTTFLRGLESLPVAW